MKTRHHYPILLIALLLGLMGFAEHAQADYTLGHYTRVEADTETPKPGHFVLGYPKAISPTAIEVKWTPAKDNVTAQEKLRYRVKCIRHSDGKEVKTSPELTNQTEYTITGIEPETEYRIQITVWDEANNSDGYGDPIVKTPPAADTEKPKPGGYVDGYPKAISPTEIVVKWNKATDNVTKQEKLRYQVRCGLFKKLVKSSPILTDETEYTITDLPYSDMTYDISVKVWDEADNVTFYSVKEVKPLEKEPKPTVQVSSVMLDQPKVTIDGDRESFRLEATVLPANATNPALQWSSSNESVATVEAVSLSSMLKSGTVEGSAVTVRIHKKGKAEITAQAMDGSGKTASCQVEVISTVGNETIDGLRVYAVDGALHLTLLAPQMVYLYDVSGALVRTMDAPAGDHVLPLAPGVYLVRIGEQIAKVLIK